LGGRLDAPWGRINITRAESFAVFTYATVARLDFPGCGGHFGAMND